MADLRRDAYVLTDDPARVDVDALHRFLSQDSYWAQGIPRDVVARAVANSLCFSLHHDVDGQVGFLRFVTDRAVFAYLMDVYVLPAHRGLGLSKWMVGQALAHPDIARLRRAMLATADAHDLYTRFGFGPLPEPQNVMRRDNPNFPAGSAVDGSVAVPFSAPEG